MEFLELAKNQRYSVRKFSDKPVEKEKLDKILESSRVCPTACNFQPQRILVLQGEEALAKVKECTRWYFGAPIILLICYDNTTCWKNANNGVNGGIVDASIATTHMMLEIADLGLGTTWIGGFSHQKIREAFNIPEFLVPVAMLPVGYPAEGVEPHPYHEKRFDMDHSVFYGSFDGIVEGEAH